jgi:hypothetical protein
MNNIEIQLDGVSYQIEDAPIIPNVSNCEFCDLHFFCCKTGNDRSFNSLCYGKIWGLPQYIFKKIENEFDDDRGESFELDIEIP